VLPDRQGNQTAGVDVVGHGPARHDRETQPGAHHARDGAEVIHLHDDARKDSRFQQHALDDVIGRAAALVDEQRLAGELARLDAAPRRPLVRRRRDHHQLVAAELEQPQPALRHR